MTLLELQRTMAESVMRPLTADFEMREKAPDGSSMRAHAATFIKPGKTVDSFERLEIYNRQYWFRIWSSFEEDFPGLRAALGEKRFDALAVAYLTEHPSKSYTLRNLGSELVPWLRANPKFAGSRSDFALDIASLEWAYVEAFDNGELPPLTTDDLAQCGADSHLTLQPHARLLELKYPVDDFVIAVHRARPSAGIASNAVGADRKSRPRRISPMAPQNIYLVVHRFDHSVYYKRLGPEAYSMLRSLSAGHSLGDAVAEAFADSSMADADKPHRVREWFSNWAELGWFCRDWSAQNPQ
jgi:hypothetical protein